MNENEQEFLTDIKEDSRISVISIIIIAVGVVVFYIAVNLLIGGERIKGTNNMSTDIILIGATKEDIRKGLVPLYNDEIPKNYTKSDIEELGVRAGDIATPKIHLVYSYVGVSNRFSWRICPAVTDIGIVARKKKEKEVQNIVTDFNDITLTRAITNKSLYKYLDRNNIDDAYFIKLAEDTLKNKTEYSSDYDIVVAINKEQSYIEVPKNYLN